MLRRSVAAALLVLAVAAGSTPARAQVSGLPVRFSGVDQGLVLGAEAGFPTEDAGGGYSVGARASYGAGRFAVSALVARYDVEDAFPNQTTLGVGAAVELLPPNPRGLSASLQAGAERFALEGDSKWHFPIGLGLAMDVPSGGVVLRPWVAPRLDLYRNGFESPADERTAFGLSGGVAVRLPGRLGFTLGYDRTFGEEDFAPATLGVGVEYRLGR